MNIEVDKKYGILLSGGLDSAALLCQILKQEPRINIQPFTIPKYDGSSFYVGPIIDYVNGYFGTSIPQSKFVGSPDVPHEKQSTVAIFDIFKNYSIDYLFMGTNKNPPELDEMEGAPKRILTSPSPKLIFPFSQMLKDEIIKLLFELGQEELINLTHSCTERKIGRCNKCWQCSERAWAFNKLNKIDTGIK